MSFKVNQYWFYIAFVFLAVTANQTWGQEKEISLKDKRVSIHRENASLGTVFRDLIERYDVPIGFEESTLDAQHSDYLFEVNIAFEGNMCRVISSSGRERKCEQIEFKAKEIKFTISADNEPLENVLNQIVLQMKHYKWEINDGVVNIFPMIGRDPRFENLMNVKVKSFINRNGIGTESKKIGYIQGNVLMTPEIIEYLRENNLGLTTSHNFSPNRGRELPCDLKYSNVTFKELLNKITKCKRGGWIIKRNDFLERDSIDALQLEI